MTNTDPITTDREKAIPAAREYLNEGLITGYIPFDQKAHLGELPWNAAAREKWEAGHGHDVRLKCYPEFGCTAIESEAMSIVMRLLAVVDADAASITAKQ